MRKWLTRFAVLMMVAVVAYPYIPRNGSQKAENAQASAPPPEPAAVSQVPLAPTKQQQQPESKPYQWHELYAPANVPNWALAILAGWAGLMALHTLKAIMRQANAMDKQSAHLESQVQMMETQSRNARDRERARLVIRSLDIPELFPVNSTLSGGRALIVKVAVENLGGSKAFNVRAWGIMGIVSDRNGDDYDVGIRQSFPSIIDADETKHFLNVTGLGREFEGIASTGNYSVVPEELAQRIRQGEVFIAASGTLVYEDVFDDTYESPFHFVWHSFGNDDGGHWMTESYWLDRSERTRRVTENIAPNNHPQI